MDLITTEVPIEGMDCAECTQHVRRALSELPGVESVEVYLGSEKAVIQHQPGLTDMTAIRKAVSAAGYSVPILQEQQDLTSSPADYARPILATLGILFGVILFVIVVGEGLGFFETLTTSIPWWLGLAIVILIGYPSFINVIRAARYRQIVAHTLMTLGVLAAITIGQWATAAVVAFFMRIGDYVEKFTTESARQAVKDLSAQEPQTARLIKDDMEIEVPINQVQVGDIILIRPGEQIPVDGVVMSGHAVVDQSAITGESMPIEAGPGTRVYAATLTSQGKLLVRTTQVGDDTTYGRVIKLVEGAEANRGEIQRLADRFSTYYLPIVIGVALMTLILSRDPLATAAVLVVACSCAFALATPIAVLASVGASAKKGVLIKGGRYLEVLPSADVLLIDKTGTLTLGKPRITDIIPFNAGRNPNENRLPAPADLNPHQASILTLAASAERYSEHPLAEAVRQAATHYAIQFSDLDDFEAIPGMGIRARLNGNSVAVGSRKLVEELSGKSVDFPLCEQLQAQGKTLLYVASNQGALGVLAAADELRPEVPQAIQSARRLGIKHIELLTGDNQLSAAALAGNLDIPYQAELLPEDKIEIVKGYQSKGRTVIMVGDGVNDAPALAQADVGIAMGAAGHGAAMEAAHILLMRQDWRLIPQVLQVARRTNRVIKGNIVFTLVYNFFGLALAAFGFLPPILAAAAQSIPDVAILVNSSRLLKQK